MSKVLIIEDSKMLCKIFNELLTKYTPFDFDIAQTYAEAKAFVSKERYQFAVADMKVESLVLMLEKRWVDMILQN